MTKEKFKTKIYPGYFFAFLVFLTFSIRVIYFFSGTNERLVTTIPDDAFCYLTIAENRAKIGIWSFDGISATTGFHPLHAYILCGINKLFAFPEFKYLVLIFGLFASLAYSYTSLIISKILYDLEAEAVIPLAQILFFTPIFYFQITSLMETWLVIPIQAKMLQLVLNKKLKCNIKFCAIFLLGFLSSLARIDSGLIWVSFSAISLFFYKNNQCFFKTTALGLLGSVYRDWETDRKSTRLNSSHLKLSRMPSSA